MNKRLQQGISLRSVADNLQISPSYLSYMENGKIYAPAGELLYRMGRMFCTYPEELAHFYDIASIMRPCETEVGKEFSETLRERPKIG